MKQIRVLLPYNKIKTADCRRLDTLIDNRVANSIDMPRDQRDVIIEVEKKPFTLRLHEISNNQVHTPIIREFGDMSKKYGDINVEIIKDDEEEVESKKLIDAKSPVDPKPMVTFDLTKFK